MNKQALVATMAEQEGITKAEAERQLEASLRAITAGLRIKGSVILSGVGRLKAVTRKARTGRNPNNGQALQIPSKTVVKFKASSILAL